MILKGDYRDAIRRLALGFLAKGSNSIDIDSYKAGFVAATFEVELIRGFIENIDVYELAGIDKDSLDKMTRIAVNLGGLFSKTVKLEIYHNYVAFYPQTDSDKIGIFLNKLSGLKTSFTT